MPLLLDELRVGLGAGMRVTAWYTVHHLHGIVLPDIVELTIIPGVKTSNLALVRSGDVQQVTLP